MHTSVREALKGLLRLPMVVPTFIYWSVGSSVTLIRHTMHRREVFYAILAISFFWTIGAVLFIQFPPLAKNVLMASKEVASLLNLGLSTVETHRANLMQKLNLHNTAEIVLYAVRKGLIV